MAGKPWLSLSHQSALTSRPDQVHINMPGERCLRISTSFETQPCRHDRCSCGHNKYFCAVRDICCKPTSWPQRQLRCGRWGTDHHPRKHELSVGPQDLWRPIACGGKHQFFRECQRNPRCRAGRRWIDFGNKQHGDGILRDRNGEQFPCRVFQVGLLTQQPYSSGEGRLFALKISA